MRSRQRRKCLRQRLGLVCTFRYSRDCSEVSVAYTQLRLRDRLLAQARVTVDQPPRTTDQRRCWPGSARTRSPARYLPASDRRVSFRSLKGGGSPRFAVTSSLGRPGTEPRSSPTERGSLLPEPFPKVHVCRTAQRFLAFSPLIAQQQGPVSSPHWRGFSFCGGASVANATQSQTLALMRSCLLGSPCPAIISTSAATA